jgi:hypothetical protein
MVSARVLKYFKFECPPRRSVVSHEVRTLPYVKGCCDQPHREARLHQIVASAFVLFEWSQFIEHVYSKRVAAVEMGPPE